MIKAVLSFSIAQRWMVMVMSAVMAAFGAWALSRLPIDAVPDITNNQVQINTLAPALSTIEVEKQITVPIETALAGMPRLQSTRSLSRNGFSQITAVFDEKTDIYFARQQVSERLGEARSSLPPNTEPHMGPISTGLGEIYMWTVQYAEPPKIKPGQSGPQSDGSFITPEGQRLVTALEREAYLRTVQDWIIRPQIKSVHGVAGVDAIGGYSKQYQVQPDAAHMASYGLSFADIARALEENNVSRGARYIERNGEGIAVRSTGRIQTLDDLADVVVTTRSGKPIRISDVATTAIGGEVRTGSASVNGHEAVIGTALMLIGGNSRTVAAAVNARLVQLSRSVPPGIEIKPLLNRTQLVDATVHTVSKNLLEGAVLVVAVLLVMLGNLRAAIIAAAVIPVAMLMTAIGMVENRISANLMSLGALDFGLIVDGAVIITENCLRHLAERQHRLGRLLTKSERLEVVRIASQEMIRPTVYGQAIIILVYVPLLSFTGVEGKMFEPMALTVILALASAFVLSLTFVPAAIAIFVSGRVTEKDNAVVGWLKWHYEPLLRKAVARPIPVIAGAGLLICFSLVVFMRLGQEFIPSLDEKNIAINALRIPSTALAQSQRMQLDIENAIARLPEVETVFSKTGTAEIASDPMPPNASDTFVILKPNDQWPDPSLPKEELLSRMSGVLNKIPGQAYEFTQPIQMRFNELLAGVRGDIAVKVFGDEFEPMLRAANRIATALRATEGAADVKVEQINGLPTLDIAINRGEIARLGLSVSAIQSVIGAAIGGQESGTVFEGDRHFAIVVKLAEDRRADLEVLRNLPVTLPPLSPGATVQTVPLSRVADFHFVEGPNQISREQGKRRVVITANVRGRDMASVVDDARLRIDQSVKLPPGYWITWGGQYENLANARERLAFVVPGCFVLIFLLLFSALGTAREAALVFSAVPLALTGGILALWLRGLPFSVSAAVGFIALSGVAVLNGLVMVSAIRQLALTRESKAATIEGALMRLRPVLMTALVAALGFVPMALATGTGAEVQRPLATVVIGGLITATFLTLFVLPALITLFGSRIADIDDDSVRSSSSSSGQDAAGSRMASSSGEP